MKCPKCEDSTLRPLTLEGVQVDRCPGCEGIWFDRTELAELLGQGAPGVQPLMGGDDPEDRSYRPGDCPRDGVRMLRVNSARAHRVTLDSCPSCRGTWLDGGEFRRIKQQDTGVRFTDLL